MKKRSRWIMKKKKAGLHAAERRGMRKILRKRKKQKERAR